MLVNAQIDTVYMNKMVYEELSGTAINIKQLGSFRRSPGPKDDLVYMFSPEFVHSLKHSQIRVQR